MRGGVYWKIGLLHSSHICGCAAKSPVVWRPTVGRARTLEAEHLLWAWHGGVSEDKQPPPTRVLSILTLKSLRY